MKLLLSGCFLLWSTGILIGLAIPSSLSAQETGIDTLHLDISKAKAIFLQRNLTLLANQYNIDISKAQVEQAKVWDNPILNTDQNVYDGKFFRHTTENGVQYGQVYIEVQQLIRTAGKIKKGTQLARDNVLNNEAAFKDVMRNLKYLLTTDLNNLSQLQQTAGIFQAEMHTMQVLVKGMDEMLKTGDVSRKENIRIKAVLFSLQNDYADNIRQQVDLQKEIGQLLQLKEDVWVVADAGQPLPAERINQLRIGDLRDLALQNRPDLQLSKGQQVFQQHNIAYQKALAVPDITISPEYDRLNSYVPNYVGLGISLPLPLFNRNKGNIRAAELTAKQADLLVIQLQDQVGKEVLAAWQKLKNATALFDNENTQLKDDYESLMKNMTESYQRREVSLIEFIDFFDAYKDTRTKQYQQIANQRNAVAELNYSIHQDIIQL
ncbi:TolC family protein [Paraflavitalea soli]|uniref:TolC family protein n=1 Tax=Paraflavitalea soli TaxID=2315862 RepID=A0A3B7N2B7_9BACT|nr:TolC family protein [Paraflavitalea soli]AXY78205.1 TolC family protein [Paraflavitalea soli]